MKTILFLILLFKMTFLFGMDKSPVSTQKINNTTLTCPTNKWCRVQVAISMTPGFKIAGGAADLTQITSSIISTQLIPSTTLNEIFSIDLKSSDTLSCTASATPTNTLTNGVSYVWRPYITCYVSGVQIYKKYITVQFSVLTTGVIFNNYFSTSTDYSFYSMEYFN